ncbi:MAG: FAD binding domain-containing protein [Paracoccaceae bacterium]
MKPAAFDYIRARSLDEATALLRAEGGDARILAGGQSLMAMINMRLVRPTLLIDVMQVPDAATPRLEGGALVVPLGTRQAAVLARPTLAAEVPLLAQALPWVGHVQTRARGTVCGSVAHADPSAEIPLVLAALGGAVHIRGRKRRIVPVAEFLTGMMQTALTDGELIEAVSFPCHTGGQAFAEYGRRHGDFALVAVAAVVSGPAVRLAVGGVNDTPALRDWPALDEAQIDDALNDLAWSLEARTDLHATARLRRDLVRRLGRHVIERARACA